MNYTEYQKLALRTAAKSADPRLDMAVLALGLVGEAGEVYEAVCDNVPLEKLDAEIGDLFWYAAVLAKACDIGGESEFDAEIVSMLAPRFEESPEDRALDIVYGTTSIAEAVKKQVGHGKPFDKGHMANMLAAIMILARTLTPTSLSEICTKNIAKLKARWPEGFKS